MNLSPRLLGPLLLVVFVTPALPAQVRSAASPAATPEETVTLSPFIIATERETGWSANETLSATRTKQALKDVPVNIDAITSDFIEDLGLYTADEVANFVANAYAPPTLENDNQGGAIAFRGLSGSTATRNYFRWYVPSDTYNVERIDFGKGSNSLIFGDVEPGGQASVFTKRAPRSSGSPTSTASAATTRRRSSAATSSPPCSARPSSCSTPSTSTTSPPGRAPRRGPPAGSPTTPSPATRGRPCAGCASGSTAAGVTTTCSACPTASR